MVKKSGIITFSSLFFLTSFPIGFRLYSSKRWRKVLIFLHLLWLGFVLTVSFFFFFFFFFSFFFFFFFLTFQSCDFGTEGEVHFFSSFFVSFLSSFTSFLGS